MDKCKKSSDGKHRFVNERRLSGAGKTFVYKLNPPECEYCGEKKPLSVNG